MKLRENTTEAIHSMYCEKCAAIELIHNSINLIQNYSKFHKYFTIFFYKKLEKETCDAYHIYDCDFNH